MAGWLSGPGQLLPVPSLYPTNPLGGTLDPQGTEVSLAPGETMLVPRGIWLLNPGGYCVVQVLDPVSGVWRMNSTARVGPTTVSSDGNNVRVANLTGCALGAIVTTAGSAYVQGSTTVTPSAGNSTWQPVVGGLISTTVSITAAGAGYGVAPLVFFPPPPYPGVQATGVAVISSGTVSSITVLNQGAGYTTAPVPQIVPNPTDPNLASGSITSNATATTTLVGAGTLAAVLCTNPGVSFSTVPSLTIAGAGTSAAATIVPMWTLTGASITSGGAGFSANTELSTLGGIPSATAAHTNPSIELTGVIPRRASVLLTANGGTIATVSTIYDGGLFTGTPTPLIETQTGAGGSTAATITLTLGSVNATIYMVQVGG